MLRISRICILAGFCAFVQLALIAQNSTSSPYTRLGYGVVADRSFGAGRSMGGIGYGLRSPFQINPMNPASYSSMDSMTFLFDVGATLQLSSFSDDVNHHRNLSGNLEYLALQFPVTRNLALSAGVLPYSYVGYTINSINTSDEVTHIDRFTGKGGLNEVFLGASIDIWKKRLAIGANVSYLFGNIDHNSTVEYITTGQQMGNLYSLKKVEMRKIKYDLGMQYTHPLSKTERMTFGLAYSPKVKLNSDSYDLVSADPYFMSNILKADTAHNQGFDIPSTLGFGASYTKDFKLILAADVSFQNWSGAHFFGENDQFKNRFKFAAGAEYIPNNFTRAYLSRVKYRAGLHYSNSYIQINDQGYNEFGVCLGAGFPMLDNRSFINASFEYVMVNPEVKTLIKEQYLRFTLTFTFNELWFMKRKID
jgi:hypothetical protein